MFSKPCQALGFYWLLLLPPIRWHCAFGALPFISRACDYDTPLKALSSTWIFCRARRVRSTALRCLLCCWRLGPAVRSAELSTVAQGFPAAQVLLRPCLHGMATGRGQEVSNLARRVTKKVFTLRTLACCVNNSATTAVHVGMSRATARSTKSGPGETR